MKKHILTTKTIVTPIGEMTAGATDAGICLLLYADSPHYKRIMAQLTKDLSAVATEGEHAHIYALQHQLNEYFGAHRREFNLPLDLHGTDFQLEAWHLLQTIPYGSVISYSAQAQAMNKRKAIRAVASANSRNKISIIIPCHRVIGAAGMLTGYGGGLWRKEWLLKLERE